jgi:phosphoribosylamine--glycine ligase
MNVLIIGGGGREHALAWKIAQSPLVETVYCAPGNPGIDKLEKGRCVDISLSEYRMLKEFIVATEVELTVVGPETPLVRGIVDALQEDGHCVFGPTAAAACLEGSKGFSKEFMVRHDIPTASFQKFYSRDDAIAYVEEMGAPIVIKADGLAAGKGVVVAHDLETAKKTIDDMMIERVFGDAGIKVVIETCLIGQEVSVLAFSDGERVLPMVFSQDHKPAFDGDEGPNTGGMGAYSPTPIMTPALQEEILEDILRPVISGMALEGTPYVGVLYAGLMLTELGPRVIEFNVRFGDPETQVVLPLMKSDIVPILQACCTGTLDQVTLDHDPGACVTVVMASGGYPGSYDKGKTITGIEAAESEDGVMVFHAGTSQSGDDLLTNGGRVLNVTAVGDDLADTISKAYAAVSKIKFDDAHYRNDIGQKALKILAAN